jgi:hypothetical protein
METKLTQMMLVPLDQDGNPCGPPQTVTGHTMTLDDRVIIGFDGPEWVAWRRIDEKE